MDGNLHAQHIQMGFRQPIFAALSQSRRYAIMGSDTSQLIEHLKLLEKFYSSFKERFIMLTTILTTKTVCLRLLMSESVLLHRMEHR